MQIQRVLSVDDELVDAFAHLMPLLSDHAPAPTADDLNEITRNAHLLVARDPDIVGVLTLTVYRVPTGLNARIDDVIVATEARGRGVGEAFAGAICAAVSAFFSIRFLVRYFETKSLKPFAIYCVIAGIASLILLHV